LEAILAELDEQSTELREASGGRPSAQRKSA
jgi:hypothetical protein